MSEVLATASSAQPRYSAAAETHSSSILSTTASVKQFASAGDCFSIQASLARLAELMILAPLSYGSRYGGLCMVGRVERSCRGKSPRYGGVLVRSMEKDAEGGALTGCSECS